MLYLPDVTDFINKNHASIRKITHSICIRYNVQSVDDVLQDVYKAIIKRDILSKYDPNHPSATKISTYLYNLIKNIVRAYRKTNESIIERHHIHMDHPELDKAPGDGSFYVEDSTINVDFENILSQNRISDAMDGINLDFALFESYLKKRDKVYNLNKRKNKAIQTKGLSVLRVFQLMRDGHSNREIAAEYGVTNMFITTIKAEIKDQLIKFGLYWEECQYRKPRKEYLSNEEIDLYAEEMRQLCK